MKKLLSLFLALFLILGTLSCLTLLPAVANTEEDLLNPANWYDVGTAALGDGTATSLKDSNEWFTAQSGKDPLNANVDALNLYGNSSGAFSTIMKLESNKDYKMSFDYYTPKLTGKSNALYGVAVTTGITADSNWSDALGSGTWVGLSTNISGNAERVVNAVENLSTYDKGKNLTEIGKTINEWHTFSAEFNSGNNTSAALILIMAGGGTNNYYLKNIKLTDLTSALEETDIAAGWYDADINSDFAAADEVVIKNTDSWASAAAVEAEDTPGDKNVKSVQLKGTASTPFAKFYALKANTDYTVSFDYYVNTTKAVGGKNAPFYAIAVIPNMTKDSDWKTIFPNDVWTDNTTNLDNRLVSITGNNGYKVGTDVSDLVWDSTNTWNTFSATFNTGSATNVMLMLLTVNYDANSTYIANIKFSENYKTDGAMFGEWKYDPTLAWGKISESKGSVTTNLSSNYAFVKLSGLTPNAEHRLSFDLICPDDTYGVSLSSTLSYIVNDKIPLEEITSTGVYNGYAIFNGGFKKDNFINAGGEILPLKDSDFNSSYTYNKNASSHMCKKNSKQSVNFINGYSTNGYLIIKFNSNAGLKTYNGIAYKQYTITYEKSDGTTATTKDGYSIDEYIGFANTISDTADWDKYKVYYNDKLYSIGDKISVNSDEGVITKFSGSVSGNIQMSNFNICDVDKLKKAVALSEGDGVANIVGEQELLLGETVTYVAHPLKGASFSGWYNSVGDKVSADETLIVTYTEDEDLIYTAKFSGSGSLSTNADLLNADNWLIKNEGDIYSTSTMQKNNQSVVLENDELRFNTIGKSTGINLTVKTNADYKIKFRYKSTSENGNAFDKIGAFNVPFNFFAVTKNGAEIEQQYTLSSTRNKNVPVDPHFVYIYSGATSDEGVGNASYKCTDGKIVFLGDNNRLDAEDSDVTVWRDVEIPFNVGNTASANGMTTIWFVLSINTTTAPMLIRDIELVDYSAYTPHGKPTEIISASQLENSDYWYSNYYKDAGAMFNEGAADTTPYWSSVTKETNLPAGGPSTALKFTSSANYPFYTLLNVNKNTVYTISFDYYIIDRTTMNDTPFYSTFIRPYTNDLTMSKISGNHIWTLAAQSDMVAGYNQDGAKSQSGVFKPTDARRSEVGKWYHFSISFDSKDLTQYLLTFVGFNPYYDYTRNSVYVGNFNVSEQAAKTGNTMSLRPADGIKQNGIRIKNSISKSLIENKDIVEYGSVVIFEKNKNNLTELSVDTQKAIMGVAYDEAKGINKIFEDNGSEITFTAVLYNFNTYNLGKNVLIRAYAKDRRGNYYYGDVLKFSVYDVLYTIDKAPINEYDAEVSNWFKEYEKTDTSITEYYKDWYENQFFYEKDEKDTSTYDYSFALVGDTQVTANKWPEKLSNIYDWIVANKNSKKIEYSLHMGDITDTVLTTGVYKEEYTATIAQFEKLKNANIPFGFVRGNHDLVVDYDRYFKAADYSEQITGSYDSTMRNTYRKIEIAGTKYLMLQIDWALNAKELAWAKKVVENNPDYNVIVTTHSYLKVGGLLLDRNQHFNATLFTGGKYSADQLFDQFFSQYENIVMVICGHISCEGVQTTFRTGKNGNKIAEILINPQGIEKRENTSYGLVGMLYFSNGGKTVSVEHYSTVFNKYYGKQNEYSFELDLLNK